jgi:hypothetical protein
LAATGVVALGAHRAAADGACGDGTQTLNGSQIICTFAQPGQKHDFHTPPGFASALVEMVGGRGGAGAQDSGGGNAGTATGVLDGFDPESGTDLDLYVGDRGDSAETNSFECSGGSGEDGGGRGGQVNGEVVGGTGGSAPTGSGVCPAGGGGSGSYVMADGDVPYGNYPDIPLAVAGGGGGGGGGLNEAGGPGGAWTGTGTGNGHAGTPKAGSTAGGGGTVAADGAGAGGGLGAEDGRQDQGGDGANGSATSCPGSAAKCNAGGGGGAGYFGGGGGGPDAGGGGGSSCAPCPIFATGDAAHHASTHKSPPRRHDFHMTAVGDPMIRFTFGEAPPSETPGPQVPEPTPGPGAQPPTGGHHNGNDPNPNTNPTQVTGNEVGRTATASCNPRIGFCLVRPPAGPDSRFSIAANGGASKATLFGTLMGGSKPDCPNYREMNSDWVSFGFRNALAGSTWHKTGTLTTRHKLSYQKALALSKKIQICFEAQYRFLTRDGYQLGGHNAVFDGVLPECAAIAPAEKRAASPCVQERKVIPRKGGWVVRFVFQVPANSRDPKALG